MRGSLLMVHASLRKIGSIEGGAIGLINAILDVIGHSGTLMMVLGAEPDTRFDARESKVDVEEMGVLPEVFRTRPGVHINDHAAARYAAHGPLAAALLDSPPLHDYHGAGSPLERFADRGGRVLRLGADIDTVTLTHLAEYRADIPNKRRLRVRYDRADIGEQWIEGLDDAEGVAEWSGGDYFSQILLEFLENDQVSRGHVGQCTAELFETSVFVDFAVEWMERHMDET